MGQLLLYSQDYYKEPELYYKNHTAEVKRRYVVESGHNTYDIIGVLAVATPLRWRALQDWTRQQSDATTSGTEDWTRQQSDATTAGTRNLDAEWLF